MPAVAVGADCPGMPTFHARDGPRETSMGKHALRLIIDLMFA